LDYIEKGKINLTQGQIEDHRSNNMLVNCTGHIDGVSLGDNPLRAMSHYDPNNFKVRNPDYNEFYGTGMVIRYSHPFMNNIEWLVVSSRELAKQFLGDRGI